MACYHAQMARGRWTRKDFRASRRDRTSIDPTQAFDVSGQADLQPAAFAIDLGTENVVAGAGGIPEAGTLARRKNGDAFHAGGGSQVHRAGVVAEIKVATFQSDPGGAPAQGAGGVVAAAPAFDKSGSDFFVFGSAKNDRPYIERSDQI